MNIGVGKIATTLVATAMLVGTGGIALAQDAGGYFTQDQADHGKALFNANCAQCHGQDLEGIEAPGLVGVDVMGNWATAQGIFGYFSVAMPPTAPGKLGTDNYVDILAYIMQRNGAQPGTKTLTGDEATLTAINLVTATAAGAPAPAADTAADTAQPKVPQAFTAGKQLPTVGGADTSQNAAAAQPAAPTVPQAFTHGKDLPTVSK